MNLSWLELRWLHATAIVLFVIGPYFLGAFRPQGEIGTLPFTKRVTRLGLSWAVVLPLTYVFGYWFFICHVRFSLGRWPRFAEHLSPILMLENRWAWTFGGALLGSLYIAGIALVVCACMPRWRHVTVYVFVYACAVATALGTTFLAPPSFRTWFFD